LDGRSADHPFLAEVYLLFETEHAELAKTLSRNGRQIIAERSGHHVQIEEPEVVVTAVRDVIAGIRK
jgi:pimeloyl-ACP methyl ester carboxylesterase